MPRNGARPIQDMQSGNRLESRIQLPDWQKEKWLLRRKREVGSWPAHYGSTRRDVVAIGPRQTPMDALRRPACRPHERVPRCEN